jgi:hypothetical protein
MNKIFRQFAIQLSFSLETAAAQGAVRKRKQAVTMRRYRLLTIRAGVAGG